MLRRHLGGDPGPRRQFVARQPQADDPVAGGAADGLDHLAGEQQPVLAPGVVALVGETRQELAYQAVLAGVDLDTVEVGLDGELRRPANPSTTAAMSSGSIHFGTSREFTSGTRDGAHSGRCEYADEPCPPAWSSEASTSEPCGRQAPTIAAQPSPHRSASGARSYGQSDGWTEAPSTTIVPQPPRARRS
jgi:hypothetical protein